MEFFGFDLISLIKTAGYAGLFFIVFAESGLFIGFFLPGDSLLFTAGFLASQGYLSIVPLSLLCFLAAILGDNFGYAFGKKVGPAIFKKEDSLIFHKKHLERAENFYSEYGPKAIVLARFLPIVRTFAPILAGVGKMRYQTFFYYNVMGAAIWALGLSFLPTAYHVIKNMEYIKRRKMDRRLKLDGKIQVSLLSHSNSYLTKN